MTLTDFQSFRPAPVALGCFLVLALLACDDDNPTPDPVVADASDDVVRPTPDAGDASDDVDRPDRQIQDISTDPGAPDGDARDSSDDADVVEDLFDAGCVPTGPEVSWEACSDGIDNDCDGVTDGGPGCSVCPPAGEGGGDETGDAACSDGLDNDCNGFVDCVDFACTNDETVTVCNENTDALCSDGVDNDGDGRIDCAGRSCTDPENDPLVTVCIPPAGSEVADGEESTEALCSNGLDDDLNGRVDCDDDVCRGVGYCSAEGEGEDAVDCADGLDNDGDGRVDCADGHCRGDTYCMGEGTDVACSDGEDNDHDGVIDCADPSCYLEAVVSVCSSIPEVCDNDEDDDGDGFADCFDPECAETCSAAACSDENPIGACETAGEVCSIGGVCAQPIAALDLTSGPTLLITEILPDPVTVRDGDGEYIEVTSVLDIPVNLTGLSISDESRDFAVPEVLSIPAGGTLVFVRDPDPLANGGIEDAARIPLSLNQDGDTIALRVGETVLHSVTYPGVENDLENTGTEALPGRSQQLDSEYIDSLTDGVGGVDPTWCLTARVEPTRYSGDEELGDYGTPGTDNLVCP